MDEMSDNLLCSPTEVLHTTQAFFYYQLYQWCRLMGYHRAWQSGENDILRFFIMSIFQQYFIYGSLQTNSDLSHYFNCTVSIELFLLYRRKKNKKEDKKRKLYCVVHKPKRSTLKNSTHCDTRNFQDFYEKCANYMYASGSSKKTNHILQIQRVGNPYRNQFWIWPISYTAPVSS